jgi:hypothetical protein
VGETPHISVQLRLAHELRPVQEVRTFPVQEVQVRTFPVQEVQVRTTESQYPLLSEAGPQDDIKDRCRVDRIVVGYNDVLGTKLYMWGFTH